MMKTKLARPEPVFGGGAFFTASFLFGSLASAAVAGMNYGRMGRGDLRLPAWMIGGLAFLAQIALLMFVIPDRLGGIFALATNLAIAAGFWAAQKREVEKRPQGGPTGRLIFAGLACLVIELTVIGGAVALLG